MPRLTAILIIAALALGACTTTRDTSPERSATEQLLISGAVDRAVERLTWQVPQGTRVFVDAANIDATAPNAFDGKYAIAAMRDRLLALGARLVADQAEADAVVEIRTGALSVDEEQTLIGIPRFDVPIPLAGPLGFPEIALFKRRERRGVAKIGVTGYSRPDGVLIHSSGPQFGFARETKWVALLFWSWTRSDLIPDEQRAPTGIEELRGYSPF